MRERESASFLAADLAALLYSQRRIDSKKVTAEIIRADPVLAELRDREPFLGKKDRFTDALRKTLRFWEIAQEHGWMQDDGIEKASSYSSGFARDYAFPPLDGIGEPHTPANIDGESHRNLISQGLPARPPQPRTRLLLLLPLLLGKDLRDIVVDRSVESLRRYVCGCNPRPDVR